MTLTFDLDLEIGIRVTCDVGYLCANFGLPRPLSSRLRPDVGPKSSSDAIERVSTFNILGIDLDTNLSWSAHINNITPKASKRLYYLKQLKRAGVPYKQLLHLHCSNPPVLEYTAPAWHHLINRTQAQHLESVQERAIHIIFNFTRGMSYPNVLFVTQIELLET